MSEELYWWQKTPRIQPHEEWVTDKPIPNQIGLTGKLTPPQFMDASPKTVPIKPPATLFERYVGKFGLKVARRTNSRFSHPEYHVEMFYPNKPTVFWDPAYDTFPMGTRSLLFVFGKVPMLKGGWHARGGPTYTEVKVLGVAESLQVNQQIKRGETPRDPGPGPYPDRSQS